MKILDNFLILLEFCTKIQVIQNGGKNESRYHSIWWIYSTPAVEPGEHRQGQFMGGSIVVGPCPIRKIDV
jgi:hypothetical protein